MKVFILFDNYAKEGFSKGWGLSYWLQNGVLFDTGEKFSYLKDNAEKFNLKFNQIKKIVLSHEHWDHTGGLKGILDINNQIEVYFSKDFSKDFKDEIKSKTECVLVDDFMKVTDNVFVSKPLNVSYKDQSISECFLVVDNPEGISILCGCSHPGILNMVELAKDYFRKDIYKVIGGFHLLREEKRVIKLIAEKLKDMGLKYIGPSHCSGEEAKNIFRKVFGENFIDIRSGQIIDL